MLKKSLLGESDSAGIQRGTFSCKSKSIKASYTMEYSRDFTEIRVVSTDPLYEDEIELFF